MHDRAPFTDTATLAPTIERLNRTFAQGRTRAAPWRRKQLQALCRMLEENERAFLDALFTDLHKPVQEAWIAELSFVRSEARHALRNLSRWMAPRKVRTPLVSQPGSSQIVPEPLGTVLVIGAWNYPLQLVLSPLVGVIAAGNCALIKPSEVAAATSALIARLVPRYLDPDAVAVVEGGVEQTTALLTHRFDHILYTGNGQVGRIVMTAAARYLTPVTLELGGKSPCIVTRNANLATTARRIAWGKWMNAGQTCIAPDYVLVERGLRDGLVAQLGAEVAKMYGDPKTSKDFGRIISQRHARRLAAYLDQGRVAFGGVADADSRYVAPTVLVDVPVDAPVMVEEIFGPVLPVLEVDDLAAAMAFVNAREKPLALYVFGNAHEADQVLAGTAAGMACINDVLVMMGVPELPFGGVGASGIGSYTGSHGFRTFSHFKPILRRGLWPDLDARYPPFTDGKLKLLKKVL